MKRNKCVPRLTLGIWRESARGYSAARREVLDTILGSGLSSEELNRRMGRGITLLNDLLDGEELDLWDAYFVDCAIRSYAARAKVDFRAEFVNVTASASAFGESAGEK